MPQHVRDGQELPETVYRLLRDPLFSMERFSDLETKRYDLCETDDIEELYILLKKNKNSREHDQLFSFALQCF